jgi:glycosyltransferase involved in cell wall biosynthesis
VNVDERSHRRPRVLQLSYACSPLRGSEAGVGWRRAVQSAKYFDTWVICEEHEFAADVRQYLAEHGEVPGLNVVFIPIDQREWRLGQIHDAVWYAVLHRWHRQVLRVAQRLHEQIRFDLVHQVTFCGYREPGYLWKLDAPFVWGPIGGAQNYPWRFLPYAGFRGAMKEACRSILNSLQLRFSRRVRSAARKASIILAANSTNEQCFARAYGVALPIMADVGIDAVSSEPRTIPHAGPLRLLWSGRLLDCKALHLLLYAMARLPADVPCELRVLGDGPLKARWQRLADRLGVAKQVAWMGWLPHREAIEQYAWADAFVFSSLRDTTGTVVVEALAAGLPIICLDHQGMHDVVTADCGIKIPVTTPRQVIAGLSEAIARLAHDPTERRRLAYGAIERAKHYLWSRQEDQMADVYDRVLADNNCPACRNKNGMQGESGEFHGSERSAFAQQPVATYIA